MSRRALRAEAEGIRSQELRVGVRSTVRITVRRLASGVTLVSGTTRPALPGRILWLRTTAVVPSRTRAVRGGTFSLRFADPAPGRYQVVFIPSGARAERSTSNVGVIR